MRPALHWPSIRGRARADAGPLLLSAVVVAVVTFLAGAVPVALGDTADEAVQAAVRQAGSDADVQVQARWEYDDGSGGGRVRTARSAEALDDLRDRSLDELGPLGEVLLPPVELVDSPYLKIVNGAEPRSFRIDYVAGGSGPAVTWVSGAAPQPSVARLDVEAPFNGPPWPVQVGVSEATAARLGVKAGDRLQVEDDNRNPKDVRVSGVFRPTDPGDPAWQAAPWLLNPVHGRDGAGITRFGGMVSKDSLPDFRLAFEPDQTNRIVRFSPDPALLTLDSAQRIVSAVVRLKATSASSGDRSTESQWWTQLDTVLSDVQDQIDAATAQAAVLLIAVTTVAVLILLLAAELLAARRSPALTVARQRGAALPSLGLELLIESALVAALAAGAGALLSALFTGAVAAAWTLPVVLAGLLAGPAFGVVRAFRATRDRRVPANRGARLVARRTAALRRLTLELAVLAAAATALTLLNRHGVLPSAGGTVLLPAAAPALAVLTGAALLLRLLPLITGLALRQALRSSRPLAVFGAARAASASARPLPVLTLVGAAALASFALAVTSTVDRGLTDGAWRTVGADARLRVASDSVVTVPETAQRIAATPGVRHAVAAQVVDVAPLVVADAERPARLVIVDSAAYRALLAETPLPALPSLPAALSLPTASSPAAPNQPTASGPAVPALVRYAGGHVRTGDHLKLPRQAAPALDLVATGIAPAVDSSEDLVVVDAATMTAAGYQVVPDTIWVTGPGAGQAAAAHSGEGLVDLRAEVEASRRDAPLVTGLIRLAWASAAMLLALGLLGFALSASAGAPERWQTLSRLRTLGLRTSEARRVAAGELLPLALLAAAGGPLLGLLLIHLTVGPLSLRLLTAQPEAPPLVLPWAALTVLFLAFPAMVAAVVPLESALRRRRRLAEVLRVGGA
ncbi:FtsX-like permease family protein [Actinoplanes siamensis]|uniref:Membrane protein n=1 Tax=Actinoplanes siamensis TaxID=1223317 RepID=A0A919N5P9_9ACTN|nr:FtsX-like permease family protein [Actinoplanes siamensis]GIF04816.1 membrane protein [Actinoplanes siamensis]